MTLATSALATRRAEHGEQLVVMSGGAEGWDELIARAAIQLGVRLWLALPNRGYAAHYWGRASQLMRNRLPEFQEIADRAERITYVMEEVHGTTALKLGGRHANFWRTTSWSPVGSASPVPTTSWCSAR